MFKKLGKMFGPKDPIYTCRGSRWCKCMTCMYCKYDFADTDEEIKLVNFSCAMSRGKEVCEGEIKDECGGCEYHLDPTRF